MENLQNPQIPEVPQVPPPSFYSDDNEKPTMNLTMKILFIALISLLLLIPNAVIWNLNDSRQATQKETSNEIAKSWSGAQMISGPIITIPYSYQLNKNTRNGGEITILPSEMDVKSDLSTQTLTRSIYESVVYNANVAISGKFDMTLLKKLRELSVPDSALQLDKAVVTIGIGDLKGIESASQFGLGNKKYNLEGTTNSVYKNSLSTKDYNVEEAVVEYVEVDYEEMLDMDNIATTNSTNNGVIEARIDLSELLNNSAVPYNINLKIKGSQAFGVTPVGKQNNITITGNYGDPSFGGMFIPSSRDIEKNNFTASWTLNSNNRNYPQITNKSISNEIANSAVVTRLIVPVDQYLKVERAIKYAIIVILLTFIAVLFVEIMTKRPIHVFQYLLIGLALILFYSLLLSLAEHINFGISYLIAAVMTIGLVGLYMWGVVGSRKIAASLSALLALIYGFIYVLLCLETFALLTGSIGLFLALATIMYASLRVKNIKNGMK